MVPGGCRRHQPLDKLEHRCPKRVRGSGRGLTGGLVLALGLAERRRFFAGGRGVLLLLAVPERHSDVSKRVRVRERASAASGGCQEQAAAQPHQPRVVSPLRFLAQLRPSLQLCPLPDGKKDVLAICSVGAVVMALGVYEKRKGKGQNEGRD